MSANDNIFYDIALHLSKKNFKFIKVNLTRKKILHLYFILNQKFYLS